MKNFLFSTLFFLIFSTGFAQTYNPANFTVSNKSYGVAQDVSTDARSLFYDATLFKMRPYQSTAEVLSYLNLSKYRSGYFPIWVNVGGTLAGSTFTGGSLTEYWFRNGTSNSDLVIKSPGTSGTDTTNLHYQDSVNAAAIVAAISKHFADSTTLAGRVNTETSARIAADANKADKAGTVTINGNSQTLGSNPTFTLSGGSGISDTSNLHSQDSINAANIATKKLNTDSTNSVSGYATLYQNSLKLASAGGTITGLGGNGYINFIPQSSSPTAPTTGFKLFATSAGSLAWMTNLGFSREFRVRAQTQSNIYHLYDRSYTVADSADVALKENSIGNPPSNGYVLSSTTSGTRSWVGQSSGGSTNVDSTIKTKTIASTVTKIHTIQDSYGLLLSGAVGTSDLLINRLATKFGWSVVNTSVAGSSANMTGFQLFKNRLQYNTDTALFMMYGLNNITQIGKTTLNFRNIENGFRLAIANNFLNTAIAANDASVTKVGTWAESDTWTTYGTKASWLSGRNISSSVANDSVSFSRTGSNVVIGFVGTDSVTLTGGIFRIRVDGVLVDSVNTNAQTTGTKLTNDSLAFKGIPCVKLISGLSTGSHTVTLSNKSGTVLYDFFGTMKTDVSTCAPVLISAIQKLPMQFWAGTSNIGGGDNNTIEQANTIIKKVIAEYKNVNNLYPIYFMDNNKFVDPNADFYTDFLHWTTTGHYKAFLNAQSYLTSNAAYYAANDATATNNDSSVSGRPIYIFNSSANSTSTISNRNTGAANSGNDGLVFTTGNGAKLFYMNSNGAFAAPSIDLTGLSPATIVTTGNITGATFLSSNTLPTTFTRANTAAQMRMVYTTTGVGSHYIGYRGGNNVFYFDHIGTGSRYYFQGSPLGIVGTPDNTGAVASFEVNPTTNPMGIALPKMTTTQRDAIPLTTTVLTNLNLTAGGSGYTSGATVSFSGGTGTATATAATTSNAVSSLLLTASSGYTAGDVVTVTITPVGAGSGATATVQVGQVGTVIFNTTTQHIEYYTKLGWVWEPIVSTGTAAPATTPLRVGDHFVDTTNKKEYVATGTSSSADWTILN